MATDTNDPSTDEQGDQQDNEQPGPQAEEQSTKGASDEKSQKEMAAEYEERRKKQLKESKRRVGTFQLVGTVLLVVIGLACLYLSTAVVGDHPLVQEALLALGILNLGLALAVQFRRNWSRTCVLFAMPLTIIIIVLTFENTMKSSLLVCLVCIGVIYVMFRQPVLDEYDAPKE